MKLLERARGASADEDIDAICFVHKYEHRPRPTWSVRPGEDLCKLAEHLFYDAQLCWLIADINAAITKEVFDGQKRIIELSVGQKIELPVWQDIVAFHTLKINVRASNTITVTK
ncbi:MAG: hypothetical protein U0105_05310 [Candidatus Obscuribacterales bacterium]